MRTELRKAPAYLGHVTDEIGEVVAFAMKTFPADPARFVILAIGIVVTGLRVADLIASQDQRQALRQQQTGELVSAQLTTKRCYLGIVGRAFMAAIGAVVLVGAVAIALAIGLVVFFVVAEQILEREAVMHGDVIDAGARRAAVMVEQVGRAGHAAGHFADQAAFAAPVAPHRGAITVVPFRQLRRKRADLIAAQPEIPGLCDQIPRRTHRALPDVGRASTVGL